MVNFQFLEGRQLAESKVVEAREFCVGDVEGCHGKEESFGGMGSGEDCDVVMRGVQVVQFGAERKAERVNDIVVGKYTVHLR